MKNHSLLFQLSVLWLMFLAAGCAYVIVTL